MNAVRARRAVGAVFFLLGTAIGLWASRIPDIKLAHQLNEAEFGLVLLAMASGAVISFPVAGRLVDRIGAAKVSKALAAFLLISIASLVFAPNLVVFVPLMFVAGWGIGALDVSMNGWGAEVEQALGKPVMSSFHGLFSLGAGAGAATGAAALWADLTVREHFSLWAVVMAVPVIYAISVPWTKAARPADDHGAKAPFLVLPKGPLALVGIMALVAALGEGAITDWAALYQIQELGFESSEAAIGFAVFSVAMVVMRFAGDRVIARFGAVPVARLSGLAAAIGTFLLVAGSELWMVWVGCAIMGIGNAVIFPLAMSRAASDPDMSPGRALAAVAMLGYGAFLLGPPVLGFIGEVVSLRAAFALVGVLALLITFLAGALKVEN